MFSITFSFQKIIWLIRDWRYLNDHPEADGTVCTPELKKLSVFRIGPYGYSALVSSNGTFVCHPHKEIQGTNVNQLPAQSAQILINKAIFGGGFSRGFYQWYTGEKYLCVVPVFTKKPYHGQSFFLCYAVDTKDLGRKYYDTLRNSLSLDGKMTPIRLLSKLDK